MTAAALVGCPDYDPAAVQAAVDHALACLGGWERFVRRGDRVLLKPNLVAARPAATTHPQILDALLSRLRDLGARPCLGDSPAFGTAAQVAEACGIGDVLRKYDAPIVEFSRPVAVKTPRPDVTKYLMVDRSVLDADVVVNVPKLKAHRQLGFTAGLKNLYGCMPGKRKAYYHVSRGNRDMDFARLVAAYAYTVAPHLTVVDAIVGMERDGPTGGDPRPVGAVIASADPAAVDALVERLICAPADDSLILNACRELKLGAPSLDRISLRGNRVEELEAPDWVHPYLVGVRFSPLRLVRSTWRNFLLTRFECGS